MVNVIIYLNKSLDAKELVDALLGNQLIANASIDLDNVSYQLENDRNNRIYQFCDNSTN